MTLGAPTVDEYQIYVRQWLAANLEPRSSSTAEVNWAAEVRTSEGLRRQRALQARLYEAGLAGIAWPSEFGGQGLSPAHEEVFTREAEAYALPNFEVAGRTTRICAQTMLAHASVEFLKLHIPRILSGAELWVQLFSEPAAGSDLAGILTRADWNGQTWVLNGAKVWTSGADYADYGMCLARTNWDLPKHKGLTWFAVRIGSPGLTVRPLRQINGGWDFCEIFLDGVELTSLDVIGEVNEGWSVTRTLLGFERVAQRAQPPRTNGRLDFAPDLVEFARLTERELQPHVRQLIAQAHTYSYVVGELTRRIDEAVRSGNEYQALSAYRKLAAGTFDPLRAQLGLSIGGEDAVVWDPADATAAGLVRNFLDGRITAIAGGSNEMMRNVIGEQILGLPREPNDDHKLPFREVLNRARSSRFDSG